MQNKETTVQSYQKMWNQNTKKSTGIEGALFNSMDEIGHFLYFYFVINLQKKIYGVRMLTAEPPPRPPYKPGCF